MAQSIFYIDIPNKNEHSFVEWLGYDLKASYDRNKFQKTCLDLEYLLGIVCFISEIKEIVINNDIDFVVVCRAIESMIVIGKFNLSTENGRKKEKIHIDEHWHEHYPSVFLGYKKYIQQMRGHDSYLG